MYCRSCGKEISDGTSFCPSCGASQNAAAPASNTGSYSSSQVTVSKPHTNTSCIVGFVIALVSLILNFWGLVGVAGLIVCIVGLSSCKRNNEGGGGLAVVGIVISIFSIGYAAVQILSIIQQYQ